MSERREERDSHGVGVVPEDGVVVEVKRRVEPKIDALLPVADATSVHICLHRDWLPRPVPQELKI